MRHTTLGLVTALLAAGVCGGHPPGPLIALEKPRAYTGKVVLLPAPKGKPEVHGVALVGEDRVTYPLVEDRASRMLALDKRLRDRPVRLTAQRVRGTTVLWVMRVQILGDDGVRDVDYWCEICQISLNHPGACYCCGQEAELRERPAR
jgi:hypothetical protein